MYTIVDINNAFEQIVTAHDQLNSFHTSGLDTLDVDKLDVFRYPLLYAQCTDADLDSGYTTFTYELIVADLVIEKQDPVLTQVYSETFLIMQDVISQFYFAVNQTSTVDGSWNIDLPLVCQPFTARFTNLLTGWSCSLDIKLPNPLNLCDAPY